MKKILISLFILSTFATPCFSQQSIEFKETKKPLLLIRDNHPVVYKPTRILIGKNNKFIIKAESGSNVILGLSASDSGAPLFHGQQLRLGTNMDQTEGKVPENGILELSINIPDDKNLVESKLYFEVLVWKNKDYSDIKKAKIVSPSGRDTETNSVTMFLPPEDPNKPTFATAMPGAPAEMMRAMETIEKIKNGEESEFDNTIMPNVYQEPAMIKNLRALELIKKQ